MTAYELTFIVTGLDLDDFEKVDQIADGLGDDTIVGRSHIGETFVNGTFEGVDGVAAARAAVIHIRRFGLDVIRLDYDLADRREIAFRLETTRQAVGNWILGKRRATSPFPTPFNEVRGGVWLWGDIVSWARENLTEDPAPGLEFPTRTDHAILAADLLGIQVTEVWADPLTSGRNLLHAIDVLWMPSDQPVQTRRISPAIQRAGSSG